MNRARLAIVVTIAAAAALLLWTALAPSTQAGGSIDEGHAPLAPVSTDEVPIGSATIPKPPHSPAQLGRVRDNGASGPATAKDATGIEPAAVDQPLYPLHVHFVLGTGDGAFPSNGFLLLEPIAAGAATANELARQPLSIPLHGATTVICPIAFGPWRLRVASEPFRHVPETILAAPTDKNGVKHEVTLWSEGEIPVRMQTADGRAVWSYAKDLGWKEKNLLYQAFDFRSSDQPFPPNLREAPAPIPSEPLGDVSFQRPHGHYSQVSLGDDIVGHVERQKAASHWLGLWVHGRFHSERFVDPDCPELLYTLALDDLLAQTGQVTFTVIDRETKAPLHADVKATLKADHAPYRRDDQKDRAPSLSGEVTFANVLPGKYDLLLERANNTAQRKINLAAEMHIDLGVIELGDDLPLIVRVLDVEGRALSATIEVADYVPGAATEDLYHPNLFRHTGQDKTYAMPIPDRRSIVRARVTDPNAFFSNSEIATVNVLVDPSALPPRLDLVAHRAQRFELSVETPWEDGHVLEIREKALDLAVQVIERPRRVVDVLKGTYVTRHLSASGELLGERTIEVTETTAAISVP